MVQLNQKYADKGLVMLGISLDTSAGDMQQGIRQGNLSWPMHLDIGGQMSRAFGVDSIPRTFLLGPDGTLLWTGHPAAGLDAAIEKAFKEHPPQLVDPKLLEEANGVLDQIDSKLKAGDAAAAIKLLGKVPAAARKDADFNTRDADVQKKLESAGDAMLAQVDPLIQKGDYVAAIAKLNDLSAALTGTPVGVKARQKLNELKSRPEAKAALLTAEKESRAGDVLTSAQALQSQKKDAQAYERFEEVVKEFPDTDAARTASDSIKAYEHDKPELVKKVSDSAAAGKAKAALSMADSYRKSQRTDLARAKYQSVIKEFPGTPYAETAKKALEEMDK